MTITSSLEINKAVCLRKLLTEAALITPSDAKTLILTNNSEEAGQIFNFIQKSSEVTMRMSMNNIFFCPITTPLLDHNFSLVVYYAMPSSIEQLFSQISLLSNNYVCRNMGSVTKLNVMHFHLMATPDGYVHSRLQLFVKAVSQLQTERVMQKIIEIDAAKMEQENQEGNDGHLRIKVSELSKVSNLQKAGIFKVLRYCVGEGILNVSQTVPLSVRLRFSNKEITDTRVGALAALVGNSTDLFLLDADKCCEALECTEIKLLDFLKALRAGGYIFFEIEEEAVNVKLNQAFLESQQESIKTVYKKMLSENMTECRLLQFAYLTYRIGASNTSVVFNKNLRNKNLTVLLKNYALAEENGIMELFPESSLKEHLDEVKGTDPELQDVDYFFRQLLHQSDHYFPEELNMCRDQAGSAAREFIRIQLVRTLLNLPGCVKPSGAIHSHYSVKDYQCIDFESLLKQADTALAVFLKRSRS